MNILLTITLILFTLITAYKTRWGLYLILILIPSFLIRTEILGIPTTFLELSIYILAIIWLIKKLRIANQGLVSLWLKNYKIGNLLKIKNWKLKIYKPYLLPVALLILAALISTVISPDKRLSLGILKGWFFDPLLFTIIFIDQIKIRKHIDNVAASLGLMTLWVSGYGIYEYIANPQNLIETARLDSIFTSANYVTMLTVPITVLLLGTLIYPPRKHENTKTRKQFNNLTIKQSSLSLTCFCVFVLLCFCVSLAAIYLTRSYSGWFALGVGLLALGLFYPAKWKRKLFIILALVACFSVFLYTQKNNPKFQALTDFQGRTAVHTRLQIWQTSWAIIKDNPILGIGLGNFHEKYLEYVLITVGTPLEYNVLKPHNLYLNLWLETGLLGLISFIWLIVIFCKKSVPRHPSSDDKWIYDRWIYIPAMTALLVQGLFDTPYFKNDLSLLFWLLIGFTLVAQEKGIINNKFLNNKS